MFQDSFFTMQMKQFSVVMNDISFSCIESWLWLGEMWTVPDPTAYQIQFLFAHGFETPAPQSHLLGQPVHLIACTTTRNISSHSIDKPSNLLIACRQRDQERERVENNRRGPYIVEINVFCESWLALMYTPRFVVKYLAFCPGHGLSMLGIL